MRYLGIRLLLQILGCMVPVLVLCQAAAAGQHVIQVQGTLQKERPRILFSSREQVERLRRRYRQDENYRQQVDRWTGGASKWLCAGDEKQGRAALEELLETEVALPDARADYGNGLEMALTYDLLSGFPDWNPENRKIVEEKLAAYLKGALSVLDGESASLWHGRFQLASSAWLAAVVLDMDNSESRRLITRAQDHFLENLKAIELSGGWPEGYSYWINNRAYPFVLACLAHLNSVEDEKVNGRIREVLRQIGLWTIYGTEPVGRFVLFGDTGPRNDLQYETQRVIDLIFLAIRDPVFRDYSRYLQGRFGRSGYYGDYRWGRPVFRGLPELDFSGKKTYGNLRVFNGVLPESRLFGRDGLGQAFIRSGWGPKDTFIFYQAGHSFSHHGHYQAGHFAITKAAPLAIKSGTYGGYFSEHRLNYYIRTVAANSLLVLEPGEKVKPNKLFEVNVSDGGQRLVMPTGSAVTSVEDWRENLHQGGHYEGGRVTAFEDSDAGYTYLSSDLTGAYNNTAYDENGGNGKVASVDRQLLYLKEKDLLLVHDRVKSVSPDYTVKWLLHSYDKPETEQEKVLLGKEDNGILESRDSSFTIARDRGVLEVQRLLPESGVICKVGGPDFRYYVETDGDDSELDGRNMAKEAKDKPWFDAGRWRVEVQPATGQEFNEFLMALKPGIKGLSDSKPACRLVGGGKVSGVRIGSTLTFFGSRGELREKVVYPLGGKAVRRIIFLDLPKDRRVRLKAGEKIWSRLTSEAGSLSLKLPENFTGQSCTVWQDRP